MNFIHVDCPESDKDLFFGPLDKDEKFVVFDDSWTMANIVTAIGGFPSVSQARKNGWFKPIPPGLSEFKVGKRKGWILNKFPYTVS